MTLAALLCFAAAIVAGLQHGFVALGWVFAWIGVLCGIAAVIRDVEVDR